MYSVLPRVDLDNLDIRVKRWLNALNDLWVSIFPQDMDEMTITSAAEPDSQHIATSLHYPWNSPTKKGLAIDVRVKDVDRQKARDIFIPRAAAMLGPGWDIVYEDSHIHIERDPKKKALSSQELSLQPVLASISFIEDSEKKRLRELIRAAIDNMEEVYNALK